MKKLFLAFTVVASALALGSCSSDEPVPAPGNGVDTKDHYIAVNIVSSPDAGSRAEAGAPYAASYEDGTTDENAVEKVRFYFFDESGNAYAVRHDSPFNYYDWTNPEYDTDTDKPNVYHQLNAVLLISTKDGDDLPAEIIAVVNPQSYDLLDNKTLSRSELRTICADYATMANKDNKFPMVNSVYLGNDGHVVKATKVTSDHFMSSSDEALKNPVVIYVERNVAKVRVKLDATLNPGANNIIKLKSKNNGATEDLKIGEQQVYLKLNGWNTTADLDLANLSKRIDETWENDILGSQKPWNYTPYYRSYWAQEVVDKNRQNRYYDFDNAKAKAFGGYTYANENAERNKHSDRTELRATKVMVNGTLCDQDGKSLTICEYYGVKFVDTDDNSTLKSNVLLHLQENGTYYYKVTTEADGTKTYTQISDKDLYFITATEAGLVQSDGKGTYYVVPSLYAKGQERTNALTWVMTPDILVKDAEGKLNVADEDIKSIKMTELDDLLRASQHAKIWETGNTYYYADIQHFDLYGLVRNHIYDVNINGIFGLGTPVYDPTEVIIPEHTTDEDTYIAAQIKILSWRVVSQNMSFEW